MPFKTRGIILLLVIFYSSHNCLARKVGNHLGFGFDNEKNEVVIPFHNSNNLIIVQARIDGGHNLNLILDTGIRSLVLFDKLYLPEINETTFNIKFTGAGKQGYIEAVVSSNHNLRLSEDVVAYQINAVILNESNKYLHEINGIKIHGAFGYQLFSRFKVKIDYKNQLITLTEPFDIDSIKGFEAVPISIHDTKPFIESAFLVRKNKWEKKNLMLDLGANHQMMIHDASNNSMGPAKVRIAEGLSGSIFGIKAYCKAVKIGTLTYHNKEMLVPSEGTYGHEQLSSIEKHGSLGGKFFKASVIIIDYINGYLFINQDKAKNL